ncbi:hypothetical protein ODD08_004688 [Salmonella enterica]|nr:hypothetical protein [Salmonella enterica]
MDSFDFSGVKTSSEKLKKQNESGEPNEKNVKITKPDRYVIAIGFEVNIDDAFQDDTLDLAIDFGHAFFYVTKNNVVTDFFSFGPTKVVAPGGEKSESIKKRIGMVNFPIKEMSKIFRFTLTKEQVERIHSEIELFSSRVSNKMEFFDVTTNNTCAKVSQLLLEQADISTPNSTSHVKSSKETDYNWLTETFNFANPYKWYNSFLKQFDHPIGCLGPDGSEAIDDTKPAEYYHILKDSWILIPQGDDPLMANGMVLKDELGRVHGTAKNGWFSDYLDGERHDV